MKHTGSIVSGRGLSAQRESGNRRSAHRFHDDLKSDFQLAVIIAETMPEASARILAAVAFSHFQESGDPEHIIVVQ